MAELEDTIESVAGQPKSASADGVSVQAQDIAALIEADKYLESKRGRANPAAQLVRNRIVPPGAV